MARKRDDQNAMGWYQIDQPLVDTCPGLSSWVAALVAFYGVTDHRLHSIRTRYLGTLPLQEAAELCSGLV